MKKIYEFEYADDFLYLNLTCGKYIDIKTYSSSGC